MTTDSTREFAAFVRARSPALIRSAYLLTGDQHLAEDLVQSALARTHRAWRRVERLGNAEAYTRRAMYHLQVSWWRKPRVTEYYPEQLPEPRTPGDDHAHELERRDVLRRALARLTVKQRTVLVLRFYEDRSVKDTAETLGCSEGTVKSQTAKALGVLRRHEPNLTELYARSFA
ncbi:SigE family RNA polymerase sigma factor [Stackebrandtia soli]|uniref:SigE family RNA polymerase sigma factor n=1 Tax=Stackebrandtia soli TaxID=1892856 RepID=UPI0039ED8D20